MSEANKALVRGFLDELHNKHNVAILDELATPTYTGHTPDGSTTGSEWVKENLSRRFAAFPDHRLTIDDQIAEGDKVVTRFTMSGTHKGEWQGIAPTGKQVTSSGVFVHRIEGGKLAERWGTGAFPSQ